jgi:hypothetical protein
MHVSPSLLVFCMFILGHLGALLALKMGAKPLLGFALGALLGVVGLIIVATLPPSREEAS